MRRLYRALVAWSVGLIVLMGAALSMAALSHVLIQLVEYVWRLT